MAKGNPKGNPQNLTPQAHALNREDRVKGGQASGKKRKLKAIAEEALTDEKRVELIDELIERSKYSSKDLELLMALIGEKPKEQIEISQEKPFEVNITVV